MIINQFSSKAIKRKITPLDTEHDNQSSLIENVTCFDLKDEPNIFYVNHTTRYHYSSEIPLSKHLFRLQPVHDLSQSLIKFKLNISGNGEATSFTGAFGNHASFVEINEPYSELTIECSSIVSINIPKMNPLQKSLTIPLVWMPWDRAMMQAYLQPPELPEAELFELTDYAMSFVRAKNYDLFEILNEINQTIYKEYTYMPVGISLFTTPYQVYANRRGVCQDFTNLFICLARLLNVPARYRMGYIYTGGDYENKLQSDASHAWIEVFLPYMGWIGFDPTNGCLAKKNHIRVACGRHYSDATPTSGTIYTTQPTTEELSTTVQVLLLNEP